jgi:hypothetical protein
LYANPSGSGKLVNREVNYLLFVFTGLGMCIAGMASWVGNLVGFNEAGWVAGFVGGLMIFGGGALSIRNARAQYDPDKMNEKIYLKGECVAIVAGSKVAIDAFVQRLGTDSGQPVDWHYAAGRGVVKAIGDVTRVRDAIPNIRTDLQVQPQ